MGVFRNGGNKMRLTQPISNFLAPRRILSKWELVAVWVGLLILVVYWAKFYVSVQKSAAFYYRSAYGLNMDTWGLGIMLLSFSIAWLFLTWKHIFCNCKLARWL